MKLMVKVFAVGALALLFMIPLAMLTSLTDERESAKRYAVKNIEQGFGKAETITLPRLEFFYSYDGKDRTKNNDRRYSTVLPDTADVKALLKVETREYSLYGAQVFAAEITVKGKFSDYDIPDRVRFLDDNYTLTSALLTLDITDKRGLKAVPELLIDGHALNTDLYGSSSGYSIAIPAGNEGEGFGFEYKLLLNGTGSIAFVPTGLMTEIELVANWPSPSFKGALPDSWSFADEAKTGFKAAWSSTSVSRDTNTSRINLNHEKISSYDEYGGDYSSYDYPDGYGFVGVSFLDEVDVYSLVERSIKYGFLFPALTFLIMFTLETLMRRPVHPIQYGLTGFALVVFFLLLLSLSEIMGFGLSYLAAGAACVGLISFYIHFAFKSGKTTALFTAFLGLLYGVLYALLNLGEYALLVGSLTVFIILAAVMILTRKYEWYSA